MDISIYDVTSENRYIKNEYNHLQPVSRIPESDKSLFVHQTYMNDWRWKIYKITASAIFFKLFLKFASEFQEKLEETILHIRYGRSYVLEAMRKHTTSRSRETIEECEPRTGGMYCNSDVKKSHSFIWELILTLYIRRLIVHMKHFFNSFWKFWSETFRIPRKYRRYVIESIFI